MATAATTPETSSGSAQEESSLELAAARAELEQVRSQLYGVLEGARSAFSAEDGILRTLAGAEQIDDVAHSLLEVLCEAFEFEVATFWLLDPEDGKLCAIAHRRSKTRRALFIERKVLSMQLPLKEGIAGRVFVERKEFLSDDAPALSHEDLAQLFEADGLNTVCAFVIAGGGAPLGVIEMERRQPLAPDHAIETAVRIIGDRIGAFIDYSQLRWRYFSLVGGLKRSSAATKATAPQMEAAPPAPLAPLAPMSRAA